MADAIPVGLVGYGYGGSVFHAPLIATTPSLKLAYVVTSRTQQAESLPGVRALASVDDLLSCDEVALVVVASPSGTHFEIARQALMRGKHVVVDKPFAVTASEADALIDLAVRENRLLTVFQNRRWDGDFLTVKQCIEDGLVGEVYHYEAHFDRFRPGVRKVWREQAGPGSGILYDLGAHLIDQSLCLFGMPDRVMADAIAQRPGAQTTDYFHLILNYGSMRAILHGSMLTPHAGPHFAVHGDLGSFFKSGMDPQEEALKIGRTPAEPDWGHDVPENFGRLWFPDGASRAVETIRGNYQRFYSEVGESIASGEFSRPPVNAADARNGLLIIEAAIRSAAEQRSVSVR